jgi:hypothetical protein
MSTDFEATIRGALVEQANHFKPRSSKALAMASIERQIDRTVTRRTPRLRTSLLGVSLVLMTAGVCLVIALPGNHGKSLHSVLPVARIRQMPPELQQLVMAVSSASAVTSPASAQWTTSTRGTANAVVMSSGVSSGAQSLPVYVVEIYSGTTPFSPSGVSVLQGAPYPSGYYITLIVSEATFAITDWSVSEDEVSLSALGTISSESLKGVKPLSMREFRTLYPRR